MPIQFDEHKRIFSIHTDNTTYQMQIDRLGTMIHLYYGARTQGSLDYLLTCRDRGFSGNPYDAGGDRTYSLDALPQEFPVLGTGDCRSTLLAVRDGDGTFGCSLRYRSHRLRRGLPVLPGLPAVYTEDPEHDDAETLEIVLTGSRPDLEVTLLYGVLPKIDILLRSAVIRNTGTVPLTLERAGAASLDLLSGEYDLLVFAGRHAMERIPERFPVTAGSHLIGSRRGESSHHYNPFMILMDRAATEEQGRCWSMQYVWSGSFRALAERDLYGQTRMQMGLGEEQFSYPLAPGERFVVPEVIQSCSTEGLAKLSENHHRCLREHVCRGVWKHRPRPVLINSWEACYFDYTGETILRMAQDAREMGIEMVVMDDGWFGNRCDDRSALGDLYPNEEKLGMPLAELVRRVHALGLRFGIWMEPESVSEDSDLYRAHPDWALQVPGRAPVRSRGQLLLDLSRSEVTEALYDQIVRVLDTGVDYVKWDVNRSVIDVYSHGTSQQGRVMHDHVLGLYHLLGRVADRYPELLVEQCAGGGGRFDAGMLYYAPQIWCSDNTDPVDRLMIQYGTSFGYPASCMGAHVSVSPNEMTGRVSSFDTRAAVAMAGTFGYELDPGKLTAAERDGVRRQIREFKADEQLIRNGRYFRLSDPRRDKFTAWIFVKEDGAEARMTAVVTETHGNMEALYVVPKGLTRGASYRIRETGTVVPADAAMDAGLPLPEIREEYPGFIWHLDRI